MLSAGLYTYHLMAYAPAGNRLMGSISGRTTAFNFGEIYPDDNLVRRFADIAHESGFVTLTKEASEQLRWFGTRRVIPRHHWDSFLVFPVVTTHPALR
jgi:hypothetical protein